MKETKVCERCGKTFSKPANCSKKTWENTRKYCSRECLYPERIKKECLYCGEEFSVSPSRRGSKYCSWECKTDAMKGKRLSPGTEFKEGNDRGYRFEEGHTPWNKGREMPEETKKKLSQIISECWEDPEYRKKQKENNPVRFGGESPHWQGGKVEIICEVCGERFEVYPYRKDTAKYCSKDCCDKDKSEMFLRENHWNWQGGLTEEHQRIRHSKEYDEWRFSVYKRDHYECQHCNKKCSAEEIVAHHIKPFAEYQELRFEVDNGTTLCRSCHKKEHEDIGLQTRFKIKEGICLKG